MANYNITEIGLPDFVIKDSFDELIREDLTKAELFKLLTLLKPYIDPSLFDEEDSIRFEYSPIIKEEDEEEDDAYPPEEDYTMYSKEPSCYTFIITKE